MKPKKASQIVCVGGICTALAALFQLAPVFIPGIGLLLSPLSSMPVILATLFSIKCGIPVYLCAGLAMFIFSPQESVIFMLTTGPFGLALGITFFKKWFIPVLTTGAVLFAGICMLTYPAGIAAFGDALSGVPVYWALLITFAFSYLYSAVWIVFFKPILKRINTN